MTDFGTKYGTRVTMSITLTNLASGSARESTVVDDTSTTLLDELISFHSKGAGAAGTSSLDVFVYTEAGSSSYSDAATGADAAFTAANRKNSRYMGSVIMNGTADVYSSAMSLAAAFGGTMPRKWGLIVINNSGAALTNTASDHEVYRLPVLGTTT